MDLGECKGMSRSQKILTFKFSEIVASSKFSIDSPSFDNHQLILSLNYLYCN